MYSTIEEFKIDIEKLSTNFNEKQPVFTGRNEILLEIVNSLIKKAADFLSINSKKESDGTLRRLRD